MEIFHLKLNSRSTTADGNQIFRDSLSRYRILTGGPKSDRISTIFVSTVKACLQITWCVH